MAKFFLHVGGAFLFNRRLKRVRNSIIFLFANFLLLASFVFTIEIILIFLSMGNVFVPMTSAVGDFLTKLVF